MCCLEVVEDSFAAEAAHPAGQMRVSLQNESSKFWKQVLQIQRPSCDSRIPAAEDRPCLLLKVQGQARTEWLSSQKKEGKAKRGFWANLICLKVRSCIQDERCKPSHCTDGPGRSAALLDLTSCGQRPATSDLYQRSWTYQNFRDPSDHWEKAAARQEADLRHFAGNVLYLLLSYFRGETTLHKIKSLTYSNRSKDGKTYLSNKTHTHWRFGYCKSGEEHWGNGNNSPTCSKDPWDSPAKAEDPNEVRDFVFPPPVSAWTLCSLQQPWVFKTDSTGGISGGITCIVTTSHQSKSKDACSLVIASLCLVFRSFTFLSIG